MFHDVPGVCKTPAGRRFEQVTTCRFHAISFCKPSVKMLVFRWRAAPGLPAAVSMLFLSVNRLIEKVGFRATGRLLRV